MSSTGRHRRAEDADDAQAPHLTRLVEARAELERARGLPDDRSRRGRKRAEAAREAAARAVQDAAEAAHAAGATWTEIGDLLGINRAAPTPRVPHRGGLVMLHPPAEQQQDLTAHHG